MKYIFSSSNKQLLNNRYREIRYGIFFKFTFLNKDQQQATYANPSEVPVKLNKQLVIYN